MSLAQDAAHRAKHGQVGTEHVLIGILDEGGNLAVKVLADLDVGADDLRAEVQASMTPAPKGRVKGKADGHLPFTPLSKRALELTAKEALRLGHNYVGSEHLLLGLLATEEGLASKVLRRMGIELHTTRQAVVIALYSFAAGQTKHASPPMPPESNQSTLDQILRRLDAIERRLSP
jgi:ATP-dependent Clp protease ATP-binding subunit ClpC